MQDTVQEISRAAGNLILSTISARSDPYNNHTTISRATAINVLHGTVLLAQKVPRSHGYIDEPRPVTAAGTNG